MNELALEKVVWMEAGNGIKAQGKIPEKSEFFQDHFPGFPVLPGVLALEMIKQTAEQYLRDQNDKDKTRYFLKQIRSTKFHAYLKPGDAWESDLKLVEVKGKESYWKAKLFHKGKVAVSAQIVLAPSHTKNDQFAA